MNKVRIILMGLFLLGFKTIQINAQTASGSDNFVAQPVPDRTVSFNVTDLGVFKPIIWGLDLAWLSESNIRRGIAFMGIDNVDVVRSSFTPTASLINGNLQFTELSRLNERLGIIDLLGPHTKVVLNCDHPSVDPWYKDQNGVGIASRWAQLMDVTARLHEEHGRKVVTISPFNEPDFTGTGQGTIDDFYNITRELKQNPRFDNIRISGGNTLNNDVALSWFNTLENVLDEGNTHQLAGSFDNYANFYQTVSSKGFHATNDELHNVMEAMVGVQYGMQTGIWWGTAELARGEFVKASHGMRLGYNEHRLNWTAASVYRNLEGHLQAFGGSSERQAKTTTYRFVSKERDVFYDGFGPQREYTMVIPGGTGYQQGQTNAERVVNITWGDDIQPVINGLYILVNRNSGKVLEVAAGSTKAGANLQQGTNTGATYQQWNVTPVNSRIGGDFSYFTFTAVHSGKSPDILNWSLDNGANIIVWDDAKSGNQQWYLDYAEDGWFYIRSRHSAKCIDVFNGSTVEAANIVQWDKNGGVNQQWRFIPVGEAVEFVAPSTPANLVATANAESVLLNWSASPEADVAGYTIFRSEIAGGSYNTIARKITSTSFVDNTTTIGGTYFYKIKAVDKSLNSSAYTSEVFTTTKEENSLVSQFLFDGNTLDNSINLNHGGSFGTTSFVTGKVGTQALALNGTNAFIQLPATLANQQNITIAAWVYWNGGSIWQRIFDFGKDQNQYMFLSPNSSAGTLRFGAWSHVAVTLGESAVTMYVNGVQVATSTAITIRPLDFKPILNYIGRSQFSDPLFNGRVDDFRVYNYELSKNEIEKLDMQIKTALLVKQHF
ncbi:RICIN domain-containing protein [Flavobacterium cellulosilyticum]|uniref:Ricin-type beta-trefoil lectin domain protein n=1 Tax=Flavobacterium cellulosilyticum TaxID=2541731 RepID=A0A4R5CAU5_9FLAO|nr:RICIN domain-containing protein [Flavobacterium cellulosilyticum]TDD94224.1 ricin-type beta-trefoil lectin domain protein [Flavobacterium cellulosilyticum]